MFKLYLPSSVQTWGLSTPSMLPHPTFELFRSLLGRRGSSSSIENLTRITYVQLFHKPTPWLKIKKKWIACENVLQKCIFPSVRGMWKGLRMFRYYDTRIYAKEQNGLQSGRTHNMRRLRPYLQTGSAARRWWKGNGSSEISSNLSEQSWRTANLVLSFIIELYLIGNPCVPH